MPIDDWDYSNDPATSTRDAVRFLSGDTDPTDPLVRNAEIAYCLVQQPNVYLAAALVCDHLARRFSRQADKSIGALSISASQRAKAFRERAAELRSDSSLTSLAEVFVGGISISGKETLKEDSDAVQPMFERGQFDGPGIAGDSLTPDWTEES